MMHDTVYVSLETGVARYCAVPSYSDLKGYIYMKYHAATRAESL